MAGEENGEIDGVKHNPQRSVMDDYALLAPYWDIPPHFMHVLFMLSSNIHRYEEHTIWAHGGNTMLGLMAHVTHQAHTPDLF